MGRGQIDTVRAYTVLEDRYFVEIDVILHPDMRLQEAHDIGQALQDKLELQIPEVFRAFVHIDVDCTHHLEHTRPSMV